MGYLCANFSLPRPLCSRLWYISDITKNAVVIICPGAAHAPIGMKLHIRAYTVLYYSPLRDRQTSDKSIA